MTGAPLPAGCDAVVMHERTEQDTDGVVVMEAMVRAGQNLLRRGAEMRAGPLVIARGSILEPARLGILAAVGRPTVAVVPRPQVVIVPTGDELVEPGQVPGPGQIRNTNAVMLGGLTTEAGARSVILPIAPDDAGPLGRAFGQALEADVLLITGGVSAGQRDLVPTVLESLGVECVFHKVRLKPGKPLWFGIGPRRRERPGTLVFGLPGNPVSGLVGFLIFVKAALAVLAGRPAPGPGWTPARLKDGFVHRGDRTTFFPSRVVEAGHGATRVPVIENLRWSGSADLLAASTADGFAIFPAGDRDYRPGEMVDFLPMR
jgi:molybdopterin molybdotransferase